ncbi:Fc.00g099720.m01.CDS01 [Cosmosporella sp. VM-42]
MALLATVKEIFQNLFHPWLFMSISISYLPGTILSLISNADFGRLLSLSGFKEAWFGNFWTYVGPLVKVNAEKRVIPLLEGRVSGGLVRDEVVGTPVEGVVLEIGAGSGMWADVFAKIGAGKDEVGNVRQRKGAAPGLKRVYGIEPNPTSAAALRQRVKDVGLDGTYEVVPVGIESINDPTAWDGRIEPGSVDCIVTILCLCSIPEPEKNVKLLYDCLKKGGRWYAYEHVQIDAKLGGILLHVYQKLTNIIWPHFIGGCELCRATGNTLREVGPWEKIDLETPPDTSPYEVLPHVIGTLTK